MIFTGVTGGEIVSMLYPLFILSPFCYIIISKESLDGPPCVRLRHDAVPAPEKGWASLLAFGNSIDAAGALLWGFDRDEHVYSQGSADVPSVSYGRFAWKEL